MSSIDEETPGQQNVVQLLQNDFQELTQIMEELTPMLALTSYQLSQPNNALLFQKAKSTIKDVSEVLEHVKSMLEEADSVTNIVKTVHFQTKGNSPKIQPFKNGVAVVSADGNVNYADIMACDFLFIGDHDAVYEPSTVTVVEDVHIILTAENPSRPQRLRFWTGGIYHLYHGWSLSSCYNLSRTSALTLG